MIEWLRPLSCSFLTKRHHRAEWVRGSDIQVGSRLNRDETGDSSSSSRSSSSSNTPVNPFNMKLLLLHLCLALHGASEAHEYYDGACPDFPPMGSLDWGRWASGDVWRAALKHNSRSSCIRLGWFSKVGLQSGSHWTFHQWEALTETNGIPVLLCWSSREKNCV